MNKKFSLSINRKRRAEIFWLLLICLSGLVTFLNYPIFPVHASLDCSVKISVAPDQGEVGSVFHFATSGLSAYDTVATHARWPDPDGFVEADILFQADADGNVYWTWDSTGVPTGDYTMVAVSQTDQSQCANIVFSVQSD